MSSVDLLCLPPHCVSQIWPSVSGFIEAAMTRGGLNEFADVEREVLAGRMLLWLAWDGKRVLAAAVTQLSIINGVKYGTIVACGGRDLSRFKPLIDGLHGHFREEGCTRSRIIGRAGWARLYPEYKVRAVVLEKEL